jgi:O-antigen/teichoic acid export membrane protein
MNNFEQGALARVVETAAETEILTDRIECERTESAPTHLAIWPRLLSGGVWAIAGRIAGAAASALVGVLITRLLTPTHAGYYFLTLSIVSVVAVLAPMRIHDAGVKFIGEAMGRGLPGQAKQAFRLMLILGGCGAATGGIILVLALPTLGVRVLRCPPLAEFRVLIALWAVLLTIQSVLSRIFQAFNKIALCVLFNGVAINVLCAGAYGFALWHGLGSYAEVIQWAFVAMLASTTAAAILILQLWRSLPGRSVSSLRRALPRVAVPLGVTAGIMIMTGQADVWIIGAFRSSSELALYAAARRVAMLGATPLSSMNIVLAALIAELYAQHRSHELETMLRGAAAITSVPLFTLLLVSVFYGRSVMSLVFGQFYAGGAGALILIVLGHCFDVWTGASGVALIMTGEQDSFLVITMVCGLIATGLSLLLVRPWGIDGVAAAVMFGSAT